ncbi:hypothetical protein H671_2g7188 [Cricetulus griseus]|uniref:Uncharacterized protein n=1 Tax=Cricetulus griseus TaxID=10029 RepID=A0A061IIR1_CRIGR|nr:hypothetical protein H671_2g7188 [Cricetulus griseus]
MTPSFLHQTQHCLRAAGGTLVHRWGRCGATTQARQGSWSTAKELKVFTASVPRFESVRDSSRELTSDRLSAGPGCNQTVISNCVRDFLIRSFRFAAGMGICQAGTNHDPDHVSKHCKKLFEPLCKCSPGPVRTPWF